MFRFSSQSFEVDFSSVKHIINITSKLLSFSFQLDNFIHFETRIINTIEPPQFYQLKEPSPCPLSLRSETKVKLYCQQQIRMEQPLQTRLPIYILIGATTILGTLLFMNWTADGGLSSLVQLLYHQHQIRTFQQELKIVINTAYYFSLLVIVCYAAGAVYHIITRKDQDAPTPHFTNTTNSALVSGFHTFLIFQALFYYLLNNDGDDLSKKYINLLPFWFLASLTIFILGHWISRWAQLKLYISGIIMAFILWILILGEIYQNGFIHKVFAL